MVGGSQIVINVGLCAYSLWKIPKILNTPKAYSIEEIRKTHQNAYAPWTKEDDDKLEKLYCEGKSTKELSEVFGRNIGAIRSRIEKLELEKKYGR